jgi:hypothetical protein
MRGESQAERVEARAALIDDRVAGRSRKLVAERMHKWRIATARTEHHVTHAVCLKQSD